LGEKRNNELRRYQQEQAKPISSRRKEIIKIRAEINELENIKTILTT
jgi:hypothetical protein